MGKEREGRSLFGILKGFSLVVIWGLFGVTYNIYSKEALEIVHAPLCLGFFQLCVGSSIVLLTWAVSPPSIAVKDSYKYVPIAACHLIGSFGTIVSMNFSSVGFTHIVKAGEPIATAFFSYMLSSRMYSAFTYGTLLLIVVGISLASANELKFSYTSLISSSIAAVFYPFRIVLSKKAGEVPSMGLSGKILFRLLTVLANALAVPLLAYDIFVSDNLTNMIDMLLKDDKLIFLVLLSGASFHIYSEVGIHIHALTVVNCAIFWCHAGYVYYIGICLTIVSSSDK